MNAGWRRGAAMLTVAALLVPAAASAQDEERFESIGRAKVVGDVSESEAQRAAKTQARVRVVEQALGVSITSNTVVSDLQVAMDIQQGLSQGVTYDEKWQGPTRRIDANTFVIEYVLLAKVKEMGGNRLAPAIKASVTPNKFVAGTPIKLRITSASDAYFGLYLVQSDDKVVRLLPTNNQEAARLKANEAFDFPGKNMTLSSAPLPDEKISLENFVIIASSKPNFFKDLVKAYVGETPEETMKKAEPVERFYDRLSKWGANLQFVTVKYLPFQVRQPE